MERAFASAIMRQMRRQRVTRLTRLRLFPRDCCRRRDADAPPRAAELFLRRHASAAATMR